MRSKIVAGNWKMNKNLDEGLALTSEIVNMFKDEVNSDALAIIAAPFPLLSGVNGLIKDTDNVFLAAQTCSEYASGAYTGEVSTSMLSSVGVAYVILGHSERRGYFHESDEILAKKTDTVLQAGMKPIFCCGESLETRESGDHFKFVCDQLTAGLFHLDADAFSKVVIAYEPIWAIGTGKTASAEQAQEMHEKLRAHVAEKYGKDIADDTSILYGGSCKPGNAAEIFAGKDVDGGLIGGASLKSRDFVDIIKAF